MKKRRSKAGETLVETLASVLIAALAFALLSTAAVTAARINAAAREDVSFRYTAEQGKTVTVTAEGTHFGHEPKDRQRGMSRSIQRTTDINIIRTRPHRG